MALLDSEVWRIKAELGFALVEVGAEPYISYVALFDSVIQPFLNSGATTTSSTNVAAAGSPTLASITLASETGFSAGARVSLDVDSFNETATIRTLTGAVATLFLQKAHVGTYPVTVEGGDAIVREILQRIADIKLQMAQTFGEGSLKKVDEVEFYQGSAGLFGALGDQLKFWRMELARALGICPIWDTACSGGSSRLAVY